MPGRWGTIASILDAERHRFILWLPVLVGTGIGVYFALPVEPPTRLATALGIASSRLSYAYPLSIHSGITTNSAPLFTAFSIHPSTRCALAGTSANATSVWTQASNIAKTFSGLMRFRTPREPL